MDRAIGFAVLLFLAACAPGGNSDSGGFWGALRITGSEAERYESIADMKANADVVVRGHLASISMGRQLQGDAAEDVVVYATADLTISETLSGTDYGASVPLEFLLGVGPKDAESAVKEVAEALPKGEIVVFLHAKDGDGEAGLFRVVNSDGLWAGTERSSLDTPLAEFPPQESGKFFTEIGGMSSLEGLIELIQSP